jgi:phosphoglycolate phosphatase-like HAD superfamily hydrolase
MRLAGEIFDLDGTLADTLPVCYEAFRAACARLGGPVYEDPSGNPVELFEPLSPDAPSPARRTSGGSTPAR